MAYNYECALLMDPKLSDDAVRGYLDQFSKNITDRGGEVVHVQTWGKRRLEYSIEGRNDAIYAFLYFRIKEAGELVAEFERQVRINDNLLREMTVRVPELKITQPPTGDSRFSESARLSHAGMRRGGFRREGGSYRQHGGGERTESDGVKPAEGGAEAQPAVAAAEPTAVPAAAPSPEAGADGATNA
jgi:small subunit ribosomal protein S6